MSKYSVALREHLGTYKAHRLGVSQDGTFDHGGQDVRHAHILPQELKWLNILEAYRKEVRAYLEAHPGVKLHRYFHHLNSSQAFAFNLFIPFLESANSEALLSALGGKANLLRWDLEFIADPAEGTNVDVSWLDTKGVRTFCEVKLAETEFGGAADDVRHRIKMEQIYCPVLRGQCEDHLLEPAAFFANYQILRNVWLAAREPSSQVLFMLPRANVMLWPPLESVLEGLAPQLRQRVRVVAMEDVLATLAADSCLPALLACHVEVMKEKYLVSSSSGIPSLH